MIRSQFKANKATFKQMFEKKTKNRNILSSLVQKCSLFSQSVVAASLLKSSSENNKKPEDAASIRC